MMQSSSVFSKPMARTAVHSGFALICLATSFWLGPSSQAVDAASKTSPAVGSKIDDFQLTDVRGREWTLDDFRDSRVIVAAFIGTECPLAKLYTARLIQLEKEYRSIGVSFIAIDSNLQDSLAEMNAFARKFELEFPFLKDGDQRVADQFGATRTPEVCVLDADRKIRYRGRIDDQFGIGYSREAPHQFELRDALEALTSNRNVLVSEQPASGCLIGRKREQNAHSDVTYGNAIASILNQRCVQCHRQGEIGPMSFTDPSEVSGWAEMIGEVVREERMPPWHANPEYGKFSNDRRLPKEERDLILNWVKAGAPLGDLSHLPTPKPIVEGWQLDRVPDLVVNVSPEPFAVPATGEVKYQYFKVDPGLDKDTWIQAAELLPGNRAVVHHILAFARPKGTRGALEGERGFLFGYVPGTRVENMPKGFAKKIPANSELIFQVHYTPIGTPQMDQSKLGMLFADPKSITHEVMTTSAVQVNLNIPPDEANYRTQAMLPEQLPDCQLLSMSPHMHLRGKSFRYSLVFPSGKREVILDIPNYDFNWQTEYRLTESRTLPAGTRMFCEAVFDNSERNLNNPNPKARVRWGDQTYEEMMIGYFHVAVPINRETGEALDRVNSSRPRVDLNSPQGIFAALDVNGDDRLEPSEVPDRLRTAVQRLDKNNDGILTKEELPK